MRRELGLNFAGGPEGGLVQRVEILADGAGRIRRIDLHGVPFFFRCRVLPVGISLDQAGVNGHALAADQTLVDAARNSRLEQMAKQLAVAKPAPLGRLRSNRLPGSAWRFFEKVE